MWNGILAPPWSFPDDLLGLHFSATVPARAISPTPHMIDQKNNLRLERFSQSLIAQRAEHGITVGDVLQRVLAHRGFIITCALGCLLLSWLYSMHKPPTFEATSLLRIDPSKP